MLKSIETQGVNRDAAIEAALAQLGMDRDSVSVEVLDNGRKGFLGLGATPARVRVTYEVPDEKPARESAKPARESAKPARESAKPARESAKPARESAKPARESAKPARESAKPARESAKSARESVKPARESAKPAREDEAPVMQPGTPLPADQIPPVGAEAARFIDGLLEKLGIEGNAVVLDTSTADHVQLEIVGPDMGPVIGRRGDTLDAIQYLSSLVANRVSEEHVRVSIDTECYRAKRAESLTRLARKMAGKVTRYHKSMTLEPMNPYERRIIHSALQEYKGVTTYSTGAEPGRRVVIAPEGRSGARGGHSSGGGHKSGR